MEQLFLSERHGVPIEPSLRGACVLLLEDDALISIDAEDMLLGLGIGRILVAHTLEEARLHVARETVDAAVLDLVIGHDNCEDFALGLVQSRVPVVFASGMRNGTDVSDALRSVPTVDKPYSGEALREALVRALAAAR